ncbi:MAG: CRISPR-associated protein [Selenomonadaceae bacterium]|nr:CRISPR-associated protein [Selenomonadaceae bacterium]
MFINHTNHPSERWSNEQITASKIYGQIADMPFPLIRADATTAEVRELVRENMEKIMTMKPAAVLCQGEFNYTFALVEQLKSLGVKVVAATSERTVQEEIMPDGSTRQVSTFRFVQFREY